MEDTFTKQVRQLEEQLKNLSPFSEVRAEIILPTAGHLANVHMEKTKKQFNIPKITHSIDSNGKHAYSFFEYKLKNRPKIIIVVRTHQIK